MNKTERMEKLNAAGINTSKYFTIDLDNGTTVHLIIDENGNCTQVKNDPIAEQIIEDGYVSNTKLHRRFITAKMFHMLNYTSYNGNEQGYTACLRNMYSYSYTFKMMLEEVRVLSKLEVRDRESFEERSHFFTKAVVIAVIDDYLEKLKKYVEALPDKKCKGVPYKRIKNVNVFNEDLYKKVYAPVKITAQRIKWAKNYYEIYNILEDFVGNMISLPWDTPKSKAWVDAYKGAGAYYTCKNLIMYHGCRVEAKPYVYYTMYESMGILNTKLEEYKGEGWKMFAFMKKLISDNNFDFKARMNEIYNK
jgi:hypothetical protein